ncbi:dystrobrevin beta-like isoform X1 [Metopolophium dirhodum]|uniref:dystrobrevin beta-like isoform X1 n=1 Tax=Metopolophium dirhodum TaxID=44670 RepID=UPI002990309E|nr:dystrobrevin beta-like isoform X1 [Metopolophium dirhodum]
MTADRRTTTDYRLQLLQEMRCQNYDMIRFASYRTACKLRYVQKKVYLHMIDIWNVIEAFRENGLNTLESHVEVNVSKFETLITSLYLNLNKRLPTQQHVHDDLLTTILLNWIMSVYSANDTMGRIRVLSIKVALVTMCSGKLMDKLRYIFSQICDQNGHMVAWKFREYLQEVLVLPSAVYESPSFHYTDQISAEIFSGNGKVTVNDFMDSMMSDPGPACLVWLPLLHRLANVENVTHPISCDACRRDNFTGFRYRCQKCHNFQMCQECFWRGRVASSHTIEHDVKEYTSYKSPSKQIGHSLRKSFRCVPEKEKANIPRFPEEPEKTINLSHIIPPSPLPCHNGFSELSISSQFNTLDSKTSSRSPDKRTMSLDYTSMDDEHKLIARYAARLAAEAKVGRAPSEGSLSLDTSRAQRELIIQLESKNREIMKEISKLRKQQEMEGFCSGFSEDNPALMSELRALRNRKHELESHLTSLQDSRRQLMDQLEGLMKLLKNHQGSPRSTPNSSPRSTKSPPPSKSAPPTPGGTLTSASSLSLMSTSDSLMVGDVRSAFTSNSLTSTPVNSSSLNSGASGSVTCGNRSLRNDLLVAADSVTNAMSSLVKELNSENPVNENISNSAILKPLGYNKKEDENIKINKDFRSDSLSRSQYNKAKTQNNQTDSCTSPANMRRATNSGSKNNSPEADSTTRWR